MPAQNSHFAGKPQQRLDYFAEKLLHNFTNQEFLTVACCHASCIDPNNKRDKNLESNERLEFLGDALLGATVAKQLYMMFPDKSEGTLSRYKSWLVSRKVLAKNMDRLDLNKLGEVGPQTQEPWPTSVKANFAEAYLGAIYEDAGWSAFDKAVIHFLGDDLTHVAKRCADLDPKSTLQIWAQRQYSQLPQYSTKQSGSNHEPIFHCTVQVAEFITNAQGKSRRDAERAAAALLLEEQAKNTDAL